MQPDDETPGKKGKTSGYHAIAKIKTEVGLAS